MLEAVKIKLSDVSSLGSAVAASLLDALNQNLPDDYDEIFIHAERIKKCANIGNQWIASDLHANDGTLFDGGGRFWQCYSKLCPDCLAKSVRRTRSELRDAIQQQCMTTKSGELKAGLPVGEALMLMTLTMPNMGLSLLESRNLIYKAWSLFRKRKWFKKTIRGGFRSEEFTLTRRGFHYHMHLLIRAGYINYNIFRAEWTDCLETVFLNSGKNFSAATSDKMAIANVKRLTDINSAIFEVAKYVTKADSWGKLRAEDLLDVARIRRFPRMVEFFGTFRVAKRLGAVCRFEAEPDGHITILDKTCLNDAESVGKWRRAAQELGVAAYLHKLDEEICELTIVRMEQLRRHYEFATFYRRRSTPALTPEQAQIYVESHRCNGVASPYLTSIAELDRFREARS